MKKLLLIFVLLFSVSLAYASNWYEIDAKTYIDQASIKQDGNTIDFWVKTLNKGDTPNYRNQKVWYSLNHIYIDCSNKTAMSKELVIYGLKNQVLASDDGLLSRYTSIVPDSLGDLTYNVFCKREY